MTDRPRLKRAISPSLLAGWITGLALLLPNAALGQTSVMVAIDPSTAQGAVAMLYGDLKTGLEKALKTPVRVERSTDFADVLRSTRTGEYDIYVVPVQVAASGLSHGYAVLADSGRTETFVLVSVTAVDTIAKLKGKRIYLPQQDSIYSYMAKGLLNEAGLSLKDFSSLQYQKTSGAGLMALEIGMADATVVRKAEYEAWVKDKAGRSRLLVESKSVPAGLSVLVKKSLPAGVQASLATWSSGSTFGKQPLKAGPDITGYNYVAGLGHFTPAQLPGAQQVSAEQAFDLIKKGAVLVDARSAKEFNARHIAGAVLVPYLEKSPKDISFNAALDDFSGLSKLDKNKPTIFSCNGAECWKSYKASKAAVAQGFKSVYWLRGGLPEWEAKGLPTVVGD